MRSEGRDTKFNGRTNSRRSQTGSGLFFADDDGQRSASIVFDMKDTSQIPGVAEPWFLAFNASVSLGPNPQDLAKTDPAIGEAAKQYGK